MSRFFLGGIVVLIALLVFGRVRRVEPEAAPVVIRRATAVSSAARPPAAAPTPAVSPAGSGTPSIDLLARVESRRRLTQAAAATYFDSLLVETDSVLRRWVTSPLVVAILPDSGQSGSGLHTTVSRAILAWEETGAIRLVLTTDTTAAQIRIGSVKRFEGERVGETHLEWTTDGVIHRARITLAQVDSRGRPLPAPAALVVAIHEIGHALGLSHSANVEDVMFESPRIGRLSARDRGTLTLLYELPLGTLKASTTR